MRVAVQSDDPLLPHLVISGHTADSDPESALREQMLQLHLSLD